MISVQSKRPDTAGSSSAAAPTPLFSLNPGFFGVYPPPPPLPRSFPQEETKLLGRCPATETLAAKPARASRRHPQLSPRGTGEAAEGRFSAKGLATPGNHTGRAQAWPQSHRGEAEGAGEAADKGEGDFSAARTCQEGEALRQRPRAVTVVGGKPWGTPLHHVPPPCSIQRLE